MVSAKNCRIRIHTSQGNQEVDFSAQSIPGGKATPIVSIKEIMAKVESFKKGLTTKLQEKAFRIVAST